MNDAILAVAALGLVAGGAIVVIDTLILRRVRRLGPRPAPVEAPPDGTEGPK